MNSYYGSVNGPSCHYKKLAKYNKCSEDEALNLSARGQVSDTDYTGFYKGSQEVISAAKQQTDALKAEYANPDGTAKTGVNFEGFDRYEGYEDPVLGGSSGPASEYLPTYKVPNYAPINPNSLTHGVPYNCGGYFNILDAYGQSSGSCTTNFINN